MPTFRALALTAALAFGPMVPAAAMTDAEKKEMGDFIRSYLVQNPEVIEEALNELKRRQEEEEKKALQASIAAHADAIFRGKADLVMGNADGKITMVEFFDYNCGYCKRAFPDVVKMTEADQDLKVVMKEFPILGPGSTFAAKAALASRAQGKYLEYHLALMGHEGKLDEASALEIAKQSGLDVEKLQADLAAPEIAAVIDANLALAQALNIQGTPAFVIDQTVIPGAIGFDGLTAAVKDIRDAGGCKVC